MVDADPMVPERPERRPATTKLLGYFAYSHLRGDLQLVSMQFHHLAHELAETLPESPELTTALRKLLEGKDAAVRAALDLQPAVDRPRPQVQHLRLDGNTQTLTVGVACPIGLTPEEVAQEVADELLERLRSVAEQSTPTQVVGGVDPNL